MRTSDLSNVFRVQRSSEVSTRLEAGKPSSDGPDGQPELSDVSAGITLHDLQANLGHVVDELVTREQMHQQQALRRMVDGIDLEKADTEAPTDHQHHTDGWRGLYEAFRKAKRTLIEAGSPPDAIPEVLASLAPTVVETPRGDAAEDVPMSGASSPVDSTQSRLQSDLDAIALTPPCQLIRVDWHRLSSDENDSVAASTSAEAGCGPSSGVYPPGGANSDD